MNTAKALLFVSTALIASTGFAAGDPVAGAQKAAVCTTCHGNNAFPGIFPLVQLGGRDADKLVIKTNKYRSGKLISPMMNMVVMLLNDKDVEDIAAYYHGLGKPALPMSGIRGDEDIQASN
ncbi:MAG: cytochrome c [Thiobacillaceae bacterium]|jgi:cytochrome c553